MQRHERLVNYGVTAVAVWPWCSGEVTRWWC